jgi:3-hydroxybutyryl-CoA dehydrogenase
MDEEGKMKVEDVKSVGIVGCGTMGPTIAVATAMKYDTVVREISDELAEKGKNKIAKFISKLADKGKLSEEEHDACVGRVKVVVELEKLKDCQVIIDATPDKLEIKSEVLSALHEICPWNTVFTTTSSLLSITALAAASGRPDKFIGTHFSIPAHLMKLVEVAKAIQTSEETKTFMFDFLKSLDKTPIETKDNPGLLVNWLLFPYLSAALKAYSLGLGTPEAIDTAAKLGLGFPIGPFQLMDFSGLDSCVEAFNALYEQTRDPAYTYPPILQKMVEAGYLGTKTGKGFHDYK